MRTTNVNATAMAAAMVSAASFATSGVFAKGLLAAGWSPGAAVTARIVGAALVLAGFVAVGLRGRLGALRRAGWPIIGYGVLGVIGVQLSYFMSLQYLPVSMALLIEYCAPVLVVGFVWATTRRRPGVLTLAGAGLAVLGLILVLDLTGASFHPIGVAWATAAAVGNAGYFLIAARSVDGISPIVMSGAGMAVAAVIMLGLVAAGVLPVAVSAAPVIIAGAPQPWWAAVGGLVVVSTVSAYLFGMVSARRLGSQTASFVALTEVAFAVLFSAVLMAERPTAGQLAGGVVMLGGVVLVKLGSRPATPEVPDPSGETAPVALTAPSGTADALG